MVEQIVRSRRSRDSAWWYWPSIWRWTPSHSSPCRRNPCPQRLVESRRGRPIVERRRSEIPSSWPWVRPSSPRKIERYPGTAVSASKPWARWRRGNYNWAGWTSRVVPCSSPANDLERSFVAQRTQWAARTGSSWRRSRTSRSTCQPSIASPAHRRWIQRWKSTGYIRRRRCHPSCRSSWSPGNTRRGRGRKRRLARHSDRLVHASDLGPGGPSTWCSIGSCNGQS